jgi:tetratricopeptide (TPR) repeat protein
MTGAPVRQLAVDLEEGRVNIERTQELASAVPPEPARGKELGALLSEALGSYADGRQRQAWAAASVVAAVAGAWIDRRTLLWPRRLLLREGALDLRARALALLGFIETDRGREDAAAALHRDSEAALHRMQGPTSARFVIGATAAERALRGRHADEAIEILNRVLRLPSLSDSQRGATQALLATALGAAGRVEDAARTFEDTAESWDRAGISPGSLAADLERGVLMAKIGDATAAQSLLSKVASAAAAARNDEVEARAQLHLGVLMAAAREHRQAANHFELAAGAARRGGDSAAVIVALRNAADELRYERDLAGAERLLLEALAVPPTPALTVDIAKAKYYLAVLRHQQGQREEADRLLDEAAADFERKLTELGADGPRLAREHVDGELRKPASLRQQLSH